MSETRRLQQREYRNQENHQYSLLHHSHDVSNLVTSALEELAPMPAPKRQAGIDIQAIPI